MSSNRAYFRRAHDSDKAAVFSFTRNTFSNGDYIPMVWEEWLRNPGGRFLAATINRRAVAVAHIAMLTPTEAWLEGVRVDPVYRRFGLATRLTQYSLKNALQMGARVLRFITSSNNAAIHALSANLGFERTVILQTYQAPAIKEPVIPLDKAQPQDLQDLLMFISESPTLKKMHNLFGSGWQFSTLEQTRLEKYIQLGQVVVAREGSTIQAAVIFEEREHDKNLVICFADGLQPALTKLLSGLRQSAFEHHLGMVSARLPSHVQTQTTSESAGFQLKGDEPFWIFEKCLSGPVSKSRVR